MMMTVPKSIAGLFAALVSCFAPVQSLVCCAFVFVCIDFVTGVLADRKRAYRAGAVWGFESGKAWRTIYKLVFILIGILLSWMIDQYILPFARLNLANIFTGFVCGVEFWSYLENAADISEHPVFRALKKLMKRRMDEEINYKKEDIENDF